MSSRRHRSLTRLLPSQLVLLALGACVVVPTRPPGSTAQPGATTPKQAVDVASYLEMFDRLAPGDVGRQTAEIAALLAIAQQTPTASNRLKYALALGAAGRIGSNPVEARRLIADLLAEAHDLQPKEVSLANAWLREFDARVALYADLARQREDSERRIQALDAEGDRRYNALNAESQRLKKALHEAERKLEAVAEMEKPLTPEGQ